MAGETRQAGRHPDRDGSRPGADAANPQAVAKIFAAKGRPADHPLIVHIPGASHLERWAIDVPDLAYELAEDFWPGPLTLILKRAPGVPDA